MNFQGKKCFLVLEFVGLYISFKLLFKITLDIYYFSSFQPVLHQSPLPGVFLGMLAHVVANTEPSGENESLEVGKGTFSSDGEVFATTVVPPASPKSDEEQACNLRLLIF